MEAMACGRPVILSDIPPHREIAEGVDFIPLIKPDDVSGFAQEINKFSEMPVSERTMIGQNVESLLRSDLACPLCTLGTRKSMPK
jgi:glycosyltransferase involved in cell wall biosynthesis